jgi:hypothetical protein
MGYAVPPRISAASRFARTAVFLADCICVCLAHPGKLQHTRMIIMQELTNDVIIKDSSSGVYYVQQPLTGNCMGSTREKSEKTFN